MQVEFAKVSFGICCLSTVLLMMALNTYDHLWWIALAFGGFGFFGYAAYPMSLELAVEESYPIDASISEVKLNNLNTHRWEISGFCLLSFCQNERI